LIEKPRLKQRTDQEQGFLNPQSGGAMAIPAKFTLTRRIFLKGTIAAGAMAPFPVLSESNTVNLGLPSGPTQRELTTAFPQKAEMILQRTRPPLLETPFDVFDRGVFTPNDQFFVRWHWAVIPQQIDVTTFRLAIRGHINNELSLSLAVAVSDSPYGAAFQKSCPQPISIPDKPGLGIHHYFKI
jgi:hypothetical protein